MQSRVTKRRCWRFEWMDGPIPLLVLSGLFLLSVLVIPLADFFQPEQQQGENYGWCGGGLTVPGWDPQSIEPTGVYPVVPSDAPDSGTAGDIRIDVHDPHLPARDSE